MVSSELLNKAITWDRWEPESEDADSLFGVKVLDYMAAGNSLCIKGLCVLAAIKDRPLLCPPEPNFLGFCICSRLKPYIVMISCASKAQLHSCVPVLCSSADPA